MGDRLAPGTGGRLLRRVTSSPAMVSQDASPPKRSRWHPSQPSHSLHSPAEEGDAEDGDGHEVALLSGAPEGSHTHADAVLQAMHAETFSAAPLHAAATAGAPYAAEGGALMAAADDDEGEGEEDADDGCEEVSLQVPTPQPREETLKMNGKSSPVAPAGRPA